MSISNAEKLRASGETQGPHVKYLIRRETHSSRAIAAITVAILLLTGLIYFIVEAILALSNKDKLLITPSEIWRGITTITDSKQLAIVTTLGIVLTLLGLIILLKAILPGALGRHSLKDSRTAYIVDDGVIASNVSRRVREVAGLPTGHVTTGVSGREITVQMTPLSGKPIDKEVVHKRVSTALEGIKIAPPTRLKLQVSEDGKVAK